MNECELLPTSETRGNIKKVNVYVVICNILRNIGDFVYLCIMEFKTKILEAVTTRQKELGVSRAELSRMTGISYRMLVAFEDGANISIKNLDKIFMALSLDVEIIKNEKGKKWRKSSI